MAVKYTGFIQFLGSPGI